MTNSSGYYNDPDKKKRFTETIRSGIASGRGLLFNYPPDVVAVCNGIPITRADILRSKRERQKRELYRKRRNPYETQVIYKPCFVWVFDNGPIFPFGGKWLAIKTLKCEWCKYVSDDIKLQAMRVFPLGLNPIIGNYRLWQEKFIEAYHRPTKNRAMGSAMAIAYAEMTNGRLTGICANERLNPVEPKPKKPHSKKRLVVPISQLSQLRLFDEN
jgi:hypothetical protein